ncbi:hypothetical protein [Acinetobacter nosocomialis]|uniref:hypothetical protein n=1 Tax=Acinetobacter nosocomialis TaxID=106654 RepID=UPI0033AA04AF
MAHKFYWCSWYQPDTEDYRPMTFPPNEQIIGWWCSGYAMDDNGDFTVSTLCAWVKAESEEDVLKAVNKDWPEITSMDQFRFCEEQEKVVSNERFPIEPYEWMQQRVEGLKDESN